MTDIKIVNENGKIVGKDVETGETVPIELGETVLDSVSTERISIEEFRREPTFIVYDDGSEYVLYDVADESIDSTFSECYELLREAYFFRSQLDDGGLIQFTEGQFEFDISNFDTPPIRSGQTVAGVGDATVFNIVGSGNAERICDYGDRSVENTALRDFRVEVGDNITGGKIIEIRGGASNVRVQNITARVGESQFVTIGHDADSSPASGVQITDNDIRGDPSNGHYLIKGESGNNPPCEELVIEGNYLADTGINAIALYGDTRRFTVANNVVVNCGHSAIACSAAHEGTISDNVIIDQAERSTSREEHSIELEFGHAVNSSETTHNVTVTGNVMVDGTGGILIRDADGSAPNDPYNLAFSGNVIRNCDEGIRIDEAGDSIRFSDTTLEGNTTDIETASGVVAYWDGVLGGGPLGGVDLSSVSGQDDGDKAMSDGSSGDTSDAARSHWTWNESGSEWVRADGQATIAPS